MTWRFRFSVLVGGMATVAAGAPSVGSEVVVRPVPEQLGGGRFGNLFLGRTRPGDEVLHLQRVFATWRPFHPRRHIHAPRAHHAHGVGDVVGAEATGQKDAVIVASGRLDGIDLVFSFEDEFNISIPDQVVQKMKSVGQVIEALREVLEKRTAPPA